MQAVTNGLEPHNEPNKRHMRMRKTINRMNANTQGFTIADLWMAHSREALGNHR